jgi:membrane protein implicated in regulation of membrane protease activity
VTAYVYAPAAIFGAALALVAWALLSLLRAMSLRREVERERVRELTRENAHLRAQVSVLDRELQVLTRSVARLREELAAVGEDAPL